VGRKIRWRSEKRRLKELKLLEGNPRKATEKQKKDLEESLGRFNLADPLIVNSDNTIIGGNLRYKELLEKFGEDYVVDVRVPDRKLSEKEVEELNLRLNKNTGEWDFDILKEKEWDLLEEVGFESEELEAIIGLEVEEDDFDFEEESRSIEEPKTKYGQVYQLGKHRVMCGDATKEDDFKVLMDGQKARLIFTDPPYNVDYVSPAGNSYAKGKYKHKKIFNDNLRDDECIEFYAKVLDNLYKFSTDDVSIYWWYASRNYWINRAAFIKTGWHISQSIIWVKNGFVISPGQDYHRCYEPCIFGWKKGKKHYSNMNIRNLRDVFNLDFSDFVELLDFWYEKRDSTISYLHPTQKPVRLAERALKKNSKKNDIVLDVFGGSGSTLIACEQTNRICYLMELDPVYVDVIVKRWEEFTGKKGKLING